ncbi:MAG: DEAD/DEAH box helicase, partial [Microbacterium sp.]
MTRILLTDEYVEGAFPGDELGDGRALLARVPVRVLRAETGRSVSTALVSVGALSVSVELDGDGALHPWCSHCGVTGCAHVAAALLALTDREEPFGVGGAGRRPAATGTRAEPVSWRSALGGILGGEAPADDAERREVALLVGVHTAGRDRSLLAAALRPALRGTRGTWVRGGISWREVAEADDPDPRWRALADLEALHAGLANFRSSRRRLFDSDGSAAVLPWGTPDWIRLDSLPSRGLWQVLRGARDAGVAFVADTAQQEAVLLDDDPVEGAIDLRRAGDALVVDARLSPQGPAGERDLPVGAPTTAVALLSSTPSRVLALRPLAAPTTAAFDSLRTRGTLVVPGEEVDDFVRDFLPELREVAPLVSSDGSYDIPESVPPDLVLAVRHAEAGARLFWEWEYAGGQRRQSGAEADLADAVERAAGRFAHLLRREPGRTGFPARDLDRDETVEFLAHVLPALRRIDGLRIEAHDELPRYAFATEEPEISFGVDPGGRDWLDLKIVVTIQGEPVPSGDLLTALARGQTYLRLMSGTVFPLTDARFARLRDVLVEARALTDQQSPHVRIPRVQVDLWQELAEIGVLSTQETAWLEAIRALGDDDIEPRSVPESVLAQLRDYQRDGFRWLDFLRRHRLGGLLADDMGLGKTVQMLAALEAARIDEPGARFLVVAPTSVVGHWVAEAARFAPGLRAVALGETSRKRGTSVADAVDEATLIVTSYAILRLDAAQFADLGVRIVVLDEAQNVKNSATRGYAAARSIDAPTTIAITGTPLENDVMELFALMTLVAPGLFGTRAWFREHFHRAIERGSDDRMARLRERVRPFLLRRTKEEVAPE